VLEDVQAQAQQAESVLQEALNRLEQETVEDVNRADWENVPALETDDGHETTADAQLRGALNDARDSLAEVEALVEEMLAEE
jgi:Tfp pilus assembly protein PilX